jgi:hypothetical protein
VFKLYHTKTSRIETIYGVRKSGPDDSQTKFLIHGDCGWHWHWAPEFVPVEARAATTRFALAS